jgi:hypothetical protein
VLYYYTKSCHQCMAKSPAQRSVPVGPRTQDRVPLRSQRYVVTSLLRVNASASAEFYHTLCERLASSTAQVEAVDDVIFGLSSSSSLFLPLTTDREILTKKMQTISPHPADTAP